MRRIIFSSIMICLCSMLYAASYSGKLPVLFIETENKTPITSKDYYLDATWYLDAMGVEGVESIGSAAAPLTMEIKGRGNYTWKDFDKKPYRIKLTDKQPLLGMKKSRHFALLAHADDSKGFMRNAVGFELSRMLGMAWTPADQPVEVVLNNDYIGLYFLTETIRVDKDRVNIVEQEDEETDAEKITGGWLVEIDNYNEDPHVTIQEGESYTMWFTYKTPEVLSAAQEAFLTEEMERIDNLVYSDKNSDELWQYLDMDALARFYIVQELMDNYESFHGSCYLHREMGANEKWVFGPVWDFGSSFNRDKHQYIYEGDVWHNHWIPEVCKFPAFMVHVREVWDTFYQNEFSQIYTYMHELQMKISAAAASDAKRWPKYGNADMIGRVEKTRERLHNNAKWLNEQWGSGDNPEYPEFSANPDYEPSDEVVTEMYVWSNGTRQIYDIVEIDSITFKEKEQGIVVRAKVPDTWKKTIYVWIWGDDIIDYEHVAMRDGDWYVYVYDGEELNIIFKNGEGWTGHENQTEDIYTTKSACYDLTQEGEEKATVLEVDCSL